MSNKPEPMLYLSDARGVYIPRDFAQGTRRECVAGVRESDWETLLAGPEHEWYWEAWDAVEQSAVVTDPTTGVRYTVYQNGDCWLIPEGMQYDEQTDFFSWPETEENENA